MSKYFVSVLFLLFIFGCSLKVPSYHNAFISKNVKLTTKKEKLLAKRFVEYWHYRSKGDLQKAYSYELPHQRYLYPLKEYKGMVGGYKGVKTELMNIHIVNENEAVVDRKVIYPNNTIIRKDKWFYVKDNWYHKFYQTIFPPSNQEEAQFQ